MTKPAIDLSDPALDPLGFTLRIHEGFRYPVKLEALRQGKSIKAFIEEAVTKALEESCDCQGKKRAA